MDACLCFSVSVLSGILLVTCCLAADPNATTADGLLRANPAVGVDHAARGQTPRLAQPYSQKYPAAGAAALTDGLLATSPAIDDPAWQGFEGLDLDAVIDLGRSTEVRELCSRFLQAPGAGVYMPAEVEYALSADGKEFRTVAAVPAALDRKPSAFIDEYWAEIKGQQARYVRVRAKNAGGWLFADELLVNPVSPAAPTRPIKGTWVVLSLPDFTPLQWETLVAECHDLGMEYLVIHFVAMNGKAFYASELIPRAGGKTPDPLEAVLAAADKRGLKVFVSNGFTGRGESSQTDAKAEELRRAVTREIAAKYAGHTSFHGWYWPDEAAIDRHYKDSYLAYVADCNKLARELTPKARTLIAPYGTRRVADDEEYRKQLRALDVDIIAYQDEVGCHRVGAFDNPWVYRRLRRIHDDVPKVKLWADMETFSLPKFVPAPFARVRTQIEGLSPFVDTILIYRYQSTLAPTESSTPSNWPAANVLYRDYRAWLLKNHPPGKASVPGDGAAPRAPAKGPLRVLTSNPRYFTDGSGRAVYLTGSHVWYNLQDRGPTYPPKPFDFEAHLGFLEKHNHNFIRLWTWELTGSGEKVTEGVWAPHPWKRTGPGQALDGRPKFDLGQFDPEYFDRLRQRVTAARDRGIYVSIMLFEGWGLQFDKEPWTRHPFNAANNTSGIDGDSNKDGKGLEVHRLEIPAVTAVQEAYVRKVIDTVNDLDNVLYEISNEDGGGTVAWQHHFIRLIQEYETKKGRRHPVGMTFRYRGGTNAELFASPADWISPNPDGGYRDDPPVADGRKVVLNDTDHLWGIGGNGPWAWKSFLRGHNPLFMDPLDDDAGHEAVRRALGQTRFWAERVNLAAMTPRDKLATSGYCLANPSGSPAEYLVYLPKGEPVTVDLSGTAGDLEVEWFNPADGKTVAGEAVRGGEARTTLTPPLKGETLLYLRGKAR